METIATICDEVKALLLKKNEQYGDSVLNPINLFAHSTPIDGIRIRLDDKYSRLVRGNDSIESDEDIHLDCIGYHIMALIAIRQEAQRDVACCDGNCSCRTLVKRANTFSDGK